MDYKAVISRIEDIDNGIIDLTQARLDSLTKPRGSLGELEEIAKRVTAITRKINYFPEQKVIFTLAADHGVADEGISAFPKEVTAQMVCNFLNGGAAINVLSRHAGARVIIADFGVSSELKPDPRLIVRKSGYGTKNTAKGPAMTQGQAEQCLNNGIEILESQMNQGIDIAVTGDMGIGNTTTSSAITACITGLPVEKVTGKGTGIDSARLEHKISVIKKILSLNNPVPGNGLDILAKIGGFEIGGMAGIILACAARKIPVILDGFNSTSAALIAALISPKCKQYMIASHCSDEPGHIIQLKHLGLKPILSLRMRLGEGTGGALALNIIEAAVKILNEMATFKEAGVSDKS